MNSRVFPRLLSSSNLKLSFQFLEPIRFTQTMQDQFTSLGKSLRFSCNATGLPIPSITWLKDGIPISNGHRITLYRSLLPKNILSSDLLLSLASSRDEGVYQCVAKNPIEEKVAGARLIVGGENNQF